jgi:hypothetical protein
MPDFAFTAQALRRWSNVPSDIGAGLAHVEDATHVTLGDVAQLASPAAAMYALRCLDCFDDQVRLRVARVIALAAGRAGRLIGDGRIAALADAWTGAFTPGQALDRGRIDVAAAELAPVMQRMSASPADDAVRLLSSAFDIARYERRAALELIDDPEAYFDFYHPDHTRTEGRFRTELSTWAEMAVAAAHNFAYEAGHGPGGSDGGVRAATPGARYRDRVSAPADGSDLAARRRNPAEQVRLRLVVRTKPDLFSFFLHSGTASPCERPWPDPTPLICHLTCRARSRATNASRASTRWRPCSTPRLLSPAPPCASA